MLPTWHEQVRLGELVPLRHVFCTCVHIYTQKDEREKEKE